MSNSYADRLLKHTVELRDQYLMLDHMLDCFRTQDCLRVEPVAEHMQEIAKTEQALKPLRDSFHQHQLSVTAPELSQHINEIVDETIELIKTIMPKLAQLEQQTHSLAKGLQPQVAVGVRARQMQNAYRSGTRSRE